MSIDPAPTSAATDGLPIDRWIFAAGDPRRYVLARRLFALLVLLRLVTWRYHAYADLPEALVWPVWYWDWLPGMPPVPVMVAFQVLGAAAAVAVIAKWRTNQAFAVMWVCFLAVAGVRAGLGKVLHNDAVPLLAMIPFLVPGPTDASAGGAAARSGWPVRGAQLLVASIYFMTGVQKLRHSGLEWVTSDNMRWVMSEGASKAVVIDAIPRWIAEREWVWRPAGFALLGMELSFPLVFVHRYLRRLLVAGAVGLHVMTLFTLELDYGNWAGVVLILFVDWPAVAERVSRRP